MKIEARFTCMKTCEKHRKRTLRPVFWVRNTQRQVKIYNILFYFCFYFVLFSGLIGFSTAFDFVLLFDTTYQKIWFFDKNLYNFSARPTRTRRTTFWLAPSNNTFLIQVKFGREKLNLKMAEILNMFREAVWFRGSERGDGVNKAIVVDRKLKHFIDNDVIIGRKLDLRKLFLCRTWLNW